MAEERQMRSGVIAWPDIAAAGGNVLLIVNSPVGDERAVADVCDALEGRVPPARLHVIAMPVWHRWLSERGWSDARMLFSADTTGRELELNHFLQSLETLRWIVVRQFVIVLGSSAHNLYNEEVKEIFEQRVGVFLGEAAFLAHTLPAPHVFALGLADLLQRFNRGRKAEAYRAAARALVDDLHRVWTERGAPSVEDAAPFTGVDAALERHLGRDLLSWDERSAIPLSRPDAVKPAARFVRYVESVLHRTAEAADAQAADLNAIIADARSRIVDQQREIDDRDRMLAELNARANELQRAIAQQQEEINRRDRRLVGMQDELTQQVAVRDRRIVEMQEELTREVAIRDRNLIELHEERTQAVNLRDSIINELRRKNKAL
jgi:hypothetical protein